MLPPDALGLFAGAVALGAVHGIEPGHGWPVAASYALDRSNRWLYGVAASLILGVGHLVSSIAMVGAFFYAKRYFDLARVDQPVEVVGGVVLGGPLDIVAGVLLVLLGIREYRHGHAHGDHGSTDDDGGDHDGLHHDRHDNHDGHGHAAPHESVLTEVGLHPPEVEGTHIDEDEGAHTHGHPSAPSHDHGHADAGGVLGRLRGYVPFVGGHSHSHGRLDEATDRGLLGIAWFAFLLGFAHEEEFEIIALCAGSPYCLELMTAYALTVIAGIVGLTMLLIGGYEHHEETVERCTPYLPVFSAAVLVGMGLGLITGVF